uniref:GDNF/GAS1 domain-containing protein n=1 Tax=Oryzias latipes TaxID=8090 RepID=A0A3P9IMU1_ORYLA
FFNLLSLTSKNLITWVDCIQASEMCNQNPHCSSRYRVMRQCLVGKEKETMLDNNKECQAALEVLLVSPLYDCRCKRGMKKELQCLQNYWTIHMGLNEDMEDLSPYEPIAPNRQPDEFGLAAISSETEKNCNPCLVATKACNLNGICKRQRSTYITTCSKLDTNKGESCNRKRCHKALRAFLDRHFNPCAILGTLTLGVGSSTPTRQWAEPFFFNDLSTSVVSMDYMKSFHFYPPLSW